MNQKKIIAVVAIIALTSVFILFGPGSMAISSGGGAVAPEQKNETVYVDTDAAGKVNSITVSVHLKAPSGAKQLMDVSNLEGVTSITPEANPAFDG